MDFLSLAATLMAVYAVAYVIQLFTRFNRLIDKVPGPMRLPIVGSMHIALGVKRKGKRHARKSVCDHIF